MVSWFDLGPPPSNSENSESQLPVGIQNFQNWDSEFSEFEGGGPKSNHDTTICLTGIQTLLARGEY